MAVTRHSTSSVFKPAFKPADACITVYGLTMRIRIQNRDILTELLECLPGGWEFADGAVLQIDRCYSVFEKGSVWQLYADQELVDQGDCNERLVASFESDVDFFVALKARAHVLVHAGVVCWRGRAIVIPGRSHSGKTTLVAALIRAGAEYYSDERAVFDTNGHVHPFPKPLFLRDGNGSRRKYRPDELGAKHGTGKVSVGLIVLTRYNPDAIWLPRLISPGQAVLALLDNTACARERPQAVLKTFARATPGAVAIQGERGEADTVVQDLLDRLSED